MKVCLISGRYPETVFNSAINHKVYADAFGYTYIHCNWPTKEKNRYLNKIQYILSYIEFFDYIVWLDDDAFFFDFTKDIMQFAPKKNAFISICKSPTFKELKTFLSSGQFILKGNMQSKRFLNKILNQEISEVKKWWQEDLGFFTNGDQDIIVYLLKTDEEFKGLYDLYDYRQFNSRYENLFGTDSHEPLILHFTGKPEIKIANYQSVQKKLNLGTSLVPEQLLKPYNLSTKKRKGYSIFKEAIKKVYRWFCN